ncbi:MAG: hypothetical protein ILP19_09920 [Oscillospiraceae bacterium]|nr:hypothetical protein [Oscillospiraceae bacterium]
MNEIFDRLKSSSVNEKFRQAIDTVRQSYEQSKGHTSVVTYTSEEREIAEGGMDGINKVLFGDDKNRIRSLLFCLELYIDPYYGHPLPYYDELDESLQRLLIQTQDDDIIDDICDLLIYQSSCSIVKAGFDRIKKEKQQDVYDRLLGV